MLTALKKSWSAGGLNTFVSAPALNGELYL